MNAANDYQPYRKGFSSETDDLERKYGGARGGKSKNSSWKSSVPNVKASSSASNSNQKSETPKKQKYVNLYSDEGREKMVMMLPGRNKCECQASKHKLINNCTCCGRIICDQEGSGPCYHCGNLVCSREELELINRGNKKGEELRRKLTLKTFVGVTPASKGRGDDEESSNFSLSSVSEDLKRATAEKDRLLEYQQNSAKRTTVFDDQSDYYSTDNVWLSPEDRQKFLKRQEELFKQKKTSKSAIKFTLDFAGRKVIEDKIDDMNAYDPTDYFSNAYSAPTSAIESFAPLRNSSIPIGPEYLMEASTTQPSSTETASNQAPNRPSRVQSLALDELQDLGSCLSMHQPYASLLVRGIKKHEGRNWYANHRGILWIASAGKPVTREEASELEKFYRLYYNENLPAPFPEQYPVSCLLGCVEVVDCLAQEQYRLQNPDGESESPYVMICQNPRELPMKFPISGKHKIYKLDPQIHQAAKAGIEFSSSIVRER